MTQADATSLILHQYNVSPFSEKVRVAFGVKQLRWFACIQPSILPKDELIALTGGYRRIPVLQIGADLYFDSLYIIEELERRYPLPSMFAGSGPGIGAGLAYWTESRGPDGLFPIVTQLLFGHDYELRPGLVEDRGQMRGAPFDMDAMAAARPDLETQLRTQLHLLELQLSDGRAFLMGNQPDVVDASFYHPIAWTRCGKGRTAALLNDYPRILAWEQRVKALGHGERDETSRVRAIDIARTAKPMVVRADSSPSPHDPRVGERVRVKYHDANSPVLEGVLTRVTARDYSVLRESTAAGELMLHMPRGVGSLSRA